MNTEKYFSCCKLCPRDCKADRLNSRGVCGTGAEPVIARASLHQWEEPCISFRNGAGTIFFSGCSLHCCYCQNNKISNEFFGKSISEKHLESIILSLRDKGADNIEFVTPTHFVPLIINILDRIKPQLDIPIIYNTGGYETIDTLRMLEGYIDVYIPDIKYYSSEVSARYSNAPDYFEYASAAVTEMIEQTGKLVYNSMGGLIKGTVIRHLVLPGQRHDSIKIMDWLAENLPHENFLVSIMDQYTPLDHIGEEFPELRRRVTKMEYNSVAQHAADLGLDGYTQGKSSASPEYVPDFDLTGLEER